MNKNKEIIIRGEDHTIGSLWQQQLESNDEVEFAGYIVEHPLEKSVKIRLETKEPGNEKEVFNKTIDNIIKLLDCLSDEFKRKFSPIISI